MWKAWKGGDGWWAGRKGKGKWKGPWSPDEWADSSAWREDEENGSHEHWAVGHGLWNGKAKGGKGKDGEQNGADWAWKGNAVDGKAVGKIKAGKGKVKGKIDAGKGKGRKGKHVYPKSTITICEVEDGRRLQCVLHTPVRRLEPSPCIISVQGSAFRGGPRLLEAPPAVLQFIEHGYVVAQVEHRGSGESGQFPRALHDVKAAVRYLRAHARELHIDPEKLCAFGNSSGAWMSTMLAVLSGRGGADKRAAIDLEGTYGDCLDQPSTVRCAVAWFPPTDFLRMDEQAVPGSKITHNDAYSPESSFMGFSIQSDPGKVSFANPLSYVDASMPPIFVVHGDQDLLVPCGQSRMLVRRLEQSGANHIYKELRGAGHGNPPHMWKFNRGLMDAMLDFYNEHCWQEGTS